MSRHDSDDIGGYIFGALIAAFFAYALIVAPIYNHFHVTCADKPIPHTLSTYFDESVAPNSSKVITKGVNGIRRVCTRNDGSVTSKEVVRKPINEVTAYGPNELIRSLRPDPASKQVHRTCPITTCADGWCSSSTGRGSCSWHGGIAY
jgi:hypothetical protein